MVCSCSHCTAQTGPRLSLPTSTVGICDPPVRPVKGQVLTLGMDPEAPLLTHVLWAPKIYLVPRRDGRLLVGATVEEKGFDETLTAGGVYELLDAAWRPLPAIEELPILETCVGFRPTSRDDAPILGASAVDALNAASPFPPLPEPARCLVQVPITATFSNPVAG